MDTKEPLASFGNYLQSVRLEKRISIERVASETRIRQEMIRRIEAEEHDQLPDPVFVRGYIKSIADAIGADAEEALTRYRQRRQRVPRAARGISRPARQGPAPGGGGFWVRLALALGGTLALIAISLYAYQLLEQPRLPAGTDVPREEPRPAPAEAVPEPPAAIAPAADAPADAAAEQAPQAPTVHRLTIEARENTWLKVIVDDRAPVKHSLQAGDTVELKAQRGYNLLVGNAAAIVLQLDGRSVAVPGKKGQVVNLELP